MHHDDELTVPSRNLNVLGVLISGRQNPETGGTTLHRGPLSGNWWHLDSNHRRREGGSGIMNFIRTTSSLQGVPVQVGNSGGLLPFQQGHEYKQIRSDQIPSQSHEMLQLMTCNMDTQTPLIDTRSLGLPKALIQTGMQTLCMLLQSEMWLPLQSGAGWHGITLDSTFWVMSLAASLDTTIHVVSANWRD